MSDGTGFELQIGPDSTAKSHQSLGLKYERYAIAGRSSAYENFETGEAFHIVAPSDVLL